MPTVEEAIAAGADVNTPNGYGVSMLMFAAGYGNTDSDPVQAKRGKPPTSPENILIVLALLNAGADPNYMSPAGGTALKTAAFNNRIGTVWVLFQHGATLSPGQDAHGLSATEIAKLHQYQEMQELLLMIEAPGNPAD